MVNLTKREIGLSGIIVLLLIVTVILSMLLLTQLDPCERARDRCYDGCGDGFGASLCKGVCTGAYEKCVVGDVSLNEST